MYRQLKEQLEEDKSNQRLKNQITPKQAKYKECFLSKTFTCFLCGTEQSKLVQHYHCFECVNYIWKDYCKKCFALFPDKLCHKEYTWTIYQPEFMLLKYLKEGLRSKNTLTLLIECFIWYEDRYYLHYDGKWVTYKEFYENVKIVASGLRKKYDLKKGDFLGVLIDIKREFCEILFACLFLGVIFVPIHFSLGADEIEFVMKNYVDDKLKCFVVYDKFINLLPKDFISKKNELICIITRNNTNDEFTNYSEIVKIGKLENKIVSVLPVRKVEESDIVVMLCTSGTTNVPKFVVIREKIFYMKFVHINLTFPLIKLAFQPLSHANGFFDIITTFFNGGRICLLTDSDPKNIFNDIRFLKPNYFSTIPRVLNFVFDQYNMKVLQEGMDKEVVKEQLKNSFGGRLTEVIVGSARSTIEVRSFIRDLLDVPVMNAYGCSEVGTCLFDNEKRKGQEYKIIDCPELGYYKNANPPSGELLVKNIQSRSVEYYKVTAEKMKKSVDKEGFYHTGDIVSICTTEDGREKVFIIDRKNNVFKLHQGEFVNLNRLESIYENCELIKEILLFPNANAKSIAALVYPLDNSHEKDVFDGIVTIAKKKGINPWEIPSKIVLVKDKFKRTGTFKKNRRRIIEQYKNEVDSIIKMEVKSDFKKSLEELNLDWKKSFVEQSGDSLTGTLLINKLRTKGISLSYKDLMNEKSIELVFENKSKVKTFDISNNSKVTIENERIKLCDIISEMKILTRVDPNKVNIFFTGSSGFIGKHILEEILIQFGKDVRIYCLVRKINTLITDGRIVQLKGDLGIEYFGFNKKSFDELSEKLDLIVHAGAEVNHLINYDDLYDVNVKSIFDIVKLSAGKSPIIYLSSSSVIRKMSSKVEDQVHLNASGYSGSKWASETLLTKCYKENSIIFRLPLIFGSRKTGNVNRKDWLCRIIETILKFKIVPSECVDEPLNIILVDFISKIIVKIMKDSLKNKNVLAQTFNMSMKNIHFSEIIKFIEQYFKEEFGEKEVFKYFPFTKWIDKIEKESEKVNYQNLKPFINRLRRRNCINRKSIMLDCSSLKNLLGDDVYPCSKMNYSDTKKMVEYLLMKSQ